MHQSREQKILTPLGFNPDAASLCLPNQTAKENSDQRVMVIGNLVKMIRILVMLYYSLILALAITFYLTWYMHTPLLHYPIEYLRSLLYSRYHGTQLYLIQWYDWYEHTQLLYPSSLGNERGCTYRLCYNVESCCVAIKKRLAYIVIQGSGRVYFTYYTRRRLKMTLDIHCIPIMYNIFFCFFWPISKLEKHIRPCYYVRKVDEFPPLEIRSSDILRYLAIFLQTLYKIITYVSIS